VLHVLQLARGLRGSVTGNSCFSIVSWDQELRHCPWHGCVASLWALCSRPIPLSLTGTASDEVGSNYRPALRFSHLGEVKPFSPKKSKLPRRKKKQKKKRYVTHLWAHIVTRLCRLA